MRALTPEEIDKVKNAPARTRTIGETYTVPGTNVVKRRPKIDTSIRDIPTWFKLPSRLEGTCFFKDQPGEHRTYVATVNEVSMCRHCFLAGR